jgi:hypothetical protein
MQRSSPPARFRTGGPEFALSAYWVLKTPAVYPIAAELRRTAYTRLQHGQPYAESLRAPDDDHPLHIHSGLLSHRFWCHLHPGAKSSVLWLSALSRTASGATS